MKTILLLLMLGAIGGCVSTHDTARDGHNPLGGGFWESEMRKGFFHIDAKSNFAMWPDYAGARLTWKFRAEKLCGSADYQELETREYAYESGPPVFGVAPKIAGKSGCALCKSAGITAEEALASIRRAK